MSFIKTPNLPKNPVSKVIISGEISQESEYTLNLLGIDVCKTRECKTLYNAVKYHPDMQFHHLSDRNAITLPSMAEYFKEYIPILNICSGNDVIERYPDDILYNGARVGDYLICNKKHTDRKICEFAENNDLEIIDVRQGYAKCNICIVSENAIITSDLGIKSALGNFPVDVLLVDDTSVLLKNFSHGFFGGATGKIAQDKLLVNGNIKFHKNADIIVKFCKKHSVEIVSLNNNFIEDIGSILPIFEK